VAAASVPTAAPRPSVLPAPSWVLWVTLPLSIIGVAFSTYLTITHFDPLVLHCSQNGIFNCAAVTTSKYAYILGIPVAFLGLGQYVVMTALCTPWAWRSKRREVHLLRLVLACVGMVFVLWLIFVELVKLDHICEYCSGVHLVTFMLFICMVLTVPKMLGWGQAEDEADA
jgi:uncharacterized membrane protein